MIKGGGGTNVSGNVFLDVSCFGEAKNKQKQDCFVKPYQIGNLIGQKFDCYFMSLSGTETIGYSDLAVHSVSMSEMEPVSFLDPTDKIQNLRRTDRLIGH